MTAAALVARLERRGLALSAEGSALVCRGNREALTPEVVAELRQRKAGLLKALASRRLHLIAGGRPDQSGDLPPDFIRALAEAIVADMDGPDV